ncbi:hypothetical protein TWF694_005772 [Orbilia ellipsospora]|uniref:Uncharacterized protein n=1 Tax=Orbilia ellipsospora TaxID=2528407 RepID=A0AAV9WRW0_9PEZI
MSEKKDSKKNLFGLGRGRRNSQSTQSAKSSSILSIFSGNKSTLSHEQVISSPQALKSEEFFVSPPRAASANPEAEPRRSFEPPQRPLTAQGDTSSFTKRNKMTVIPEASHPNLIEKALADAKAAEMKKSMATLEVPNVNTEGIPGIPQGSYRCDHHNLPFPIVPLDTPHPPNTAEIVCRTHMHKHIVPIPTFTPDDIKITVDITQEPLKIKRTDIIGRSRVLDEMISKLPYGHPLDLSHYNTFVSTRLVQWLAYAQFQYTDLDTRAINNPMFDFVNVVASLQLFDLWKRMKVDLAASLAVKGVGKFDCSQFFEVLARMYAAVNKIEPKDRRELDGLVDKALARFPFIEICRVISKLSTDRPGLVILFQTIILQKGKRDHLKEEKGEAEKKLKESEIREPSLAKDIRSVVDATTEISAQMRNILTAQIAGQQNKPNQQIQQGRASLDRTPDRGLRHTSRMGRDPWAESGTSEEKQSPAAVEFTKGNRVEKEIERSWVKDRARSRVI